MTMRPFLRTTQCIGKTCRQRAASYAPQLQGQERIKAGNITLVITQDALSRIRVGVYLKAKKVTEHAGDARMGIARVV